MQTERTSLSLQSRSAPLPDLVRVLTQATEERFRLLADLALVPRQILHLERAYENFARHVEELLLQHAGEQTVPWVASLEALLRAIDGQGLDWYLVGSAALAVRGLDVAPGDVDLVVDPAGAYRLADLLLDALMEPVRPTSGWIGECFGHAFLHASVDWVGGVDPTVDTYGPNDFGPAAAARLETVR